MVDVASMRRIRMTVPSMWGDVGRGDRSDVFASRRDKSHTTWSEGGRLADEETQPAAGRNESGQTRGRAGGSSLGRSIKLQKREQRRNATPRRHSIPNMGEAEGRSNSGNRGTSAPHREEKAKGELRRASSLWSERVEESQRRKKIQLIGENPMDVFVNGTA